MRPSRFFSKGPEVVTKLVEDKIAANCECYCTSSAVELVDCLEPSFVVIASVAKPAVVSDVGVIRDSWNLAPSQCPTDTARAMIAAAPLTSAVSVHPSARQDAGARGGACRA
jgi:hypothetical protein